MKVQKILLSESRPLWLVLGYDDLPIKPISEYIRYLDNIGQSPNTIKAYANHLRHYWDYLNDIDKDWTITTLDDFAGFIAWLRVQNQKIIQIAGQVSHRTEATINVILAAVSSFYEYHHQIGNTGVKLTKTSSRSFRRYKPLLHHINRAKPTQSRLIKIKQPIKLPKVLTDLQTKQLLSNCDSLRERFLVALLYETGMRIGQALSLYHDDIRSWDNEIHIVPKIKNRQDACNKAKSSYVIHVSKALMGLYSQYLVEEYPDCKLPNVFVNKGEPLSYGSVSALFKKLSKATDFKVTAHMLRHTHATELIKAGWDYSYVQKRLGHRSIQTTISNYLHLTNDDLKKAYQEYQDKRLSNV